jgi:mRNA-degrading endonuclease RelE of RelBE toxin-antitoxin system
VTCRVEVTPEFEQDLDRLDRKTARRVLEKVEWLAAHPEAIPAPMKHMPRDLLGLRKYRVGDYRVFFWVNSTRRLLTLYGVEHRRSAYRDF